MTAIARLDTAAANFEAGFAALLTEARRDDPEIESAVRAIIDRVRGEGDAALLELSARFDRVEARSVDELRIGAQRVEAAWRGLATEQAAALELAAERIRAFHTHQIERSWQYREADGTLLGQQVTALDRVGLYVPGGKASYPSSVLMNALPARVAGVGSIVMTVPAPEGKLSDLVLAAARLAEVDEIYTLGGAQAIAALAYGTASIAPVDKIVGPGNAYVAAAKRLVFGEVGIDMVAGPSEILIICDGATPADWIAMDLFAQAEHDERARAILLCPDPDFIDEVADAIDRLLPEMGRAPIIGAALAARGALIRVRDLDQAVDLANRIAPEHLELSVEDPERWATKVRHAGAIFLGRHTPEALGDYCAGPNHVLPTARTARFSSVLGVYDFQKRTSLIGCSLQGARGLVPTASLLARGESLTAHARSAELRIGERDGDG